MSVMSMPIGVVPSPPSRGLVRICRQVWPGASYSLGVALLMFPEPGGGEGADGEPDEAGGAAVHVMHGFGCVVVVVVVVGVGVGVVGESAAGVWPGSQGGRCGSVGGEGWSVARSALI